MMRFGSRLWLIIGIILVNLLLAPVQAQEVTPTPTNPQIVYDNKNTPMVYVPEGTFQMGVSIEEAIALCKTFVTGSESVCDADVYAEMGFVSEPAEVNLHAFYLDEYEVSLAAYLDCVNIDVCDSSSIYRQMDAIQSGDSIPLDVPVTGISYYDAAVYCAWREARLPTESEWEYAARGENNWVFPWGNEFDGTKANFCDKSCENNWNNAQWDDTYKELAPVTAFDNGTSWVGAHNMAGNAAEWTSTKYTQGIGVNADVRIVKGGSYLSYAHWLAGWIRLPSGAAQGREDTGFRCARSTQP